MKYSLKPVKEQVIVITGASSGIGLATARAAAAKGAKLVLVSRNQEELAKIEQEIKSDGGRAKHVTADVGKKEDLQRVADAAIKHFGGFDTWINNAGVSIYGRLEEVSEEDNRRLFDTNFWGVVSGSLVAAKHLKARGGAIINIGSELSDLGITMQGMYAASKHAVKGFTDSLRMELQEENAPISVTLVKPAGINTPYPEHAKNYTEQELTLPAPVYAPEEVAKAILHAAAHPERDLYVGGASKIFSTLNKFAPSLVDWVNQSFMSEQQLKDKPAGTKKSGLHQHGEGGRVDGKYEGHVQKSFYTRTSINPVISGVVLAAASAAAIALIGSKRMKGKNESGSY